MGALESALEDPVIRAGVVSSGAEIVEAEVRSKSGLRGAALRAGFRAFRAVRPGIVTEAVARLLPHFVPVLDPHWDRARESGDPHGYFRGHAPEVADGLLEVTDGMAGRATNRVMVRLYRSLRGQARGHVIAAVPRIPELIEIHLPL